MCGLIKTTKPQFSKVQHAFWLRQGKKVLKEGLFKTHLSSFGKKLLPGMSQCVRLVKQNWPHIKMTSYRPIQYRTKNWVKLAVTVLCKLSLSVRWELLLYSAGERVLLLYMYTCKKWTSFWLTL